MTFEKWLKNFREHNQLNCSSDEALELGCNPCMANVTKGEATVHFEMPIEGVNHVAVGILGTNKCIAICGISGAEDFEESKSNAVKIASLWNAALENQWQPIETAPKDKTRILVKSGSGKVKIIKWDGVRPPRWQDDCGLSVTERFLIGWQDLPK